MQVELINEQCLLLRFGEKIDADLSEHVIASCRQLRQHYGHAIEDLTPSYASVLIKFVAGKVDLIEAAANIGALIKPYNGPKPHSRCVARHFEIPVLYDPQVAPDLASVCQQTGLSQQQVIKRHCQPSYRIFAIGFAPGFCFLGPLDSSLRLPRKATPRLKVPAGSVAIAEQQTAVYPSESPGGWHLIGHTPLDMRALSLDSESGPRIGDQIQFVPISREQWQNWT